MRRNWATLSLSLIATSLALVFFQNCGSQDGGKISSPLVYKLGDQEIAQGALPAEQKVAACLAEENWQCLARDYQPEAAVGEKTERICAEMDGQRICVFSRVIPLDSREAFANCADCSDQDLLPGGRYNFRDGRCYNQAIRSREGFPISSSSADLTQALTEAMSQCLAAATASF